MLLEKALLHGVRWASPGPGPDDRQHIQLGDGLAGQENALGIGPRIRRNKEQPVSLEQSQIILGQPLDRRRYL